MTKAIENARIGKKETILIRHEEIPVRATTLPQDTLLFFVDNPRIYSVLRKDDTTKPSQDEIQAKLLGMDHVKELIEDIKRDGGLTDPIIVLDGTLEVLEGNSRLAAYRRLAQFDPVKWSMIKVRLLPKDTDEKLIMALLGQYHLRGKTAWPAFEKAGFLYRRHKSHDISIEQLANEVGETRHKVDHMVRVYDFMHSNGEVETARWSYYDEYLKSRSIEKVRTNNNKFDQLIVQKIKHGEISRAVEIREKLAVICKAPRPLKKFQSGEYDFEEAYAWAVNAGADSTPYMRLKRFRAWLAKQETERNLSQVQGETRDKVKFELKRLGPVVTKLTKKLSD